MNFQQLKTDSFDSLLDVSRIACPQCGKKRKYFCYSCYVILTDPKKIPIVDLPISVTIVKHSQELDGKSTAVHARLLAPRNVSIVSIDQCQALDESNDSILLYPSPDSQTLDEIDLKAFSSLVVIDATWYQANQIIRNFPKIKKVRIDERRTSFWRYQHVGDSCLATIEAIYYFFIEYHEKGRQLQYDERFDNLLYYYKFFYEMIQTKYKSTHREFVRKSGYIEME